MNQLIRDSIKTSIRDLREIRRSKSCSALMGYGHTVAVKNTFCSIRQWVDGESNNAYNFTATWNHRSTFWSKLGATKNLDKLRKQRPELQLEVIHHDELRSRHEKHALFVLQSFFPIRNKA
jgi:hypothetical protein